MRDENIHLFADFTLDLARGCLLCAGEPVHLRPQSYEVLKYLAENKGRLIGKDRLIEMVWRGRAVTDDALVQCLIEVRHALGAGGKFYVKNVRGRGYIFDPAAGERQTSGGGSVWTEQVDLLRVVVEDEEEVGTAGETGQTASQQAGLMTHGATAAATAKASAVHAASRAGYAVRQIKRHKHAAIIALTALALVAAAGVVYFTRFAPRGQAIRSVAVLPFANGSGDPNLEYLSDGLSESLIDRLSQLPDVKVIARSSAFKYKGQEVDPRESAKALGVEALVMGRIVQRGDDLQVRAELVDARAGTQVWGEQYSRKATDIQAMQEEIARTISEKLRSRLSGAQEQQLTKRPTENAQAYQLFLAGVFHQRKGSKEGFKKALEYFDQAVALDPNFALAFAHMPGIYANLAATSALDHKEALAKGKAAAQKALELDGTLAWAHNGLGVIKMQEWDWPGAESAFKRAIELSPNLASSHTNYAFYLNFVGRTSEALAENRRAQELDPLSITPKANEGGILSSARRYDEAVQVYQNVIRMQPDYPFAHSGLGHTYAAKGMYAEAIDEYQTAISLYGEVTNGLIDLGYAYAMSGRRDEALAILNKLKASKEYVSPAVLAILHVGQGDKEAAFGSLERAYSEHDLSLRTLKVDPRYDSLRSDPRFKDLVRKVGLPP